MKNKLSICQNCKHWIKGTHSEYDKDFVWWALDAVTNKTKRLPHPNAGKTVNRPAYLPNETYGECTYARNEQDDDGNIQFFTTSEEGLYTVLMTDPSHGCLEFADAPEDWDHWKRELVKNKPRREDK